VPGIGQALQEVVTALVPNQRTERFEKYLLYLSLELDALKISLEALKKPENIDLIEDGAYQAVRALTDERKQYLARAVAKGIASEDQSKLKEKRILGLLSQLDDEQLMILAAYGSHFVSASVSKIAPPLATHGSPTEVKEKRWFFDWCVHELVRLDLLTERITTDPNTNMPRRYDFSGKPESSTAITWLGKAVLAAVDLLPPPANGPVPPQPKTETD
jgi:hypothetical protein